MTWRSRTRGDWSVAVGFIFWGAVAAAVLVGFWFLVDHKVDSDERREARCAAMNGYVIGSPALCRDRKTNSVLATWEELSDDASGGTS